MTASPNFTISVFQLNYHILIIHIIPPKNKT
nr:MAG TPA: hypothetical protein [Caudoviricetes sp.]